MKNTAKGKDERSANQQLTKCGRLVSTTRQRDECGPVCWLSVSLSVASVTPRGRALERLHHLLERE